jgi:hypothetical protein
VRIKISGKAELHIWSYSVGKLGKYLDSPTSTGGAVVPGSRGTEVQD